MQLYIGGIIVNIMQRAGFDFGYLPAVLWGVVARPKKK